MAFAHLHVHDTYSLLDGYGVPEAFARECGRLGLVALAQTNHGTISGHIAHHAACKAEGIHPVFGCEFYLVDDAGVKGLTEDEEKMIKIYSGTKAEKEKLKKEILQKHGRRSHILVIAENDEGYRNLRTLVSKSFLDGFYWKPRIDYKMLVEHKEGLFISTACQQGHIPEWLLRGEYDSARNLAETMKEQFGDQFALEIMPLSSAEQEKINLGLQALAVDLNLPVIATNDVHYPREEHAWAQEVLLAIGTRKTFDDNTRLKFGGGELFLRSEEQMKWAFRRFHPDLTESFVTDALNLSHEVAFRCNVDPLRSVARLPDFPTPEGHESHDEYLRHLCMIGWKKKGATKWPKEVQKKYGDRVKYELGILKEKGFANYFLIVWDIVKWAKDEKGIAVGPARGSSAGSLVAYLLGITDVDPIRFGLSFERFISPHRTDYPDIDIDFEDARRQEVKEYIAELWGEDHVANVATFNTLGFRSAFRDSARVFQVPAPEVNRTIGYFDGDQEEDDATFNEPLMDNFSRKYPNVMKATSALTGQLRTGGTHAAGVVLADRPLKDIVAMELRDGAPVVALTKDEAEALGLVKIDILGLKTMSVLSWAIKKINEKREKSNRAPITLESLTTSLNDKRIFDEFAIGNTEAVFQFNKPGGKKLCIDLRVSKFKDLVIVNALDRPGPLQSGGTDAYIRRRNGEATKAPNEIYGKITKDTHGVLLYQEQVMQLCRELAGLDWADVHAIRKAIAKSKGIEALERFWEIFRDGVEVQGTCNERVARWIWDQVVRYGGYAFNLSHAVAYATIGYATMWCKVYYPAEYLCAAMRYGTNPREAVLEARRRGVKVNAPDINFSGQDYSIVDDEIYAGLESIKGIGEAAAGTIMKAKEAGPFMNFLDFHKRTKGRQVHKGIMEALITAGAFDSMHKNTPALLEFHRTISGGDALGLFDEQKLPKELNKRTKIPEKLMTKRISLLPFTPRNHPALGYADILKKFDKLYPKRTDIAELRTAGRRRTRNEVRTISGILVKFEVKSGDYGTRKKIGLATIEDESGEMVIRLDPKRFPDEVEQWVYKKGHPIVAVVSPISEYRADVREAAHLPTLRKAIEEDEGWLSDSMERLLEAPGRVVAPFRKKAHKTLKRAVKLKFPTVVGIVMRVWEGWTRRGDAMGFVDLADETDQQLVLLWPTSWARLQDKIEEGQIYEARLATTKDHTLSCDTERGHYFKLLTPED